MRLGSSAARAACVSSLVFGAFGLAACGSDKAASVTTTTLSPDDIAAANSFDPDIPASSIDTDAIGTAQIDMSALRTALETASKGRPWQGKVTAQELLSGRDVTITGMFDAASAAEVCEAASAYIYAQAKTDDTLLTIQQVGEPLVTLYTRFNKAGACTAA